MISKYYHQCVNGYDQRNLRERILLLIVAVLVVYVLWYMLFEWPLQTKQKAMISEQSMLHDQIDNTQTQINKLSAEIAQQKSDPLQIEYASLLDQRATYMKNHQDLTNLLANRQDFLQALTPLLKTIPGVSLLSLKTLEPRALTNGPTNEFFAQGITIVFRSDYFSAYAYLKALEAIKISFFWQGLDYHVVKYPVGEVTFNLFLLSKQAGVAHG